jgi:transcription-repair coupling factor (superfamily II helicase)
MPVMPPIVSFGDKLNRAVDTINRSERRQLALSSLAGSAGLLLTSLLSDDHPAPLLVITENYETGVRFCQDLTLFASPEQIHFFPHWDTVPYDGQSPDKEVTAVRFQTLERILAGTARITVTTPAALMHRLMPPEVFSTNAFDLKVSAVYDREILLGRLTAVGFSRVDMVEERGEFAVRGSIIDLFPITASTPIRLDFFDDELDSIKAFDVETQRSLHPLEAVRIVPAQEIIWTEDAVRQSLERLISLKSSALPQAYAAVSEQIRSRTPFPGVENLLPLFFDKTATLLDYFKRSPLVIYRDRELVAANARRFFDEVLSEYEYARQEGLPLLDPETLFVSDRAFFTPLQTLGSLDIQALNPDNQVGAADFGTVDNTALRALARSPESTDKGAVYCVFDQLRQWHLAGARIAIAAGSPSKAERIRQMLQEIDLSVSVAEAASPREYRAFFLQPLDPLDRSFWIWPAAISCGFRWVDSKGETRLALISEEEIFGPRRRPQRVRQDQLKQFFSSLNDLRAGDFVVHVEYGIGRYQGLKKITAGQHEADYLVIVYHDGDKVYVPVEKFNLVQKYAGGEVGQPVLNKLGSKSWSKTKQKIRSEIDDMATELVRIHAERQAKRGVAFSADATLMSEFVLAFPFQETEDQERAIREVMQDMEMEKPMDRLVCGDVGFGKTEVAMRAAYKAAIDGYQVAILVPTTILAQQHYDSFQRRFAETAVTIGMLSRFRTPRQVKCTLSDLASGQLDVVIGTHRLLSKDVVFKRLGLLVIDEEQRFGVKHKETIKQLKTTVDTLTLSATPIPRTLHMSLVGIRDISVINTPPIDRRAIRTRLLKFNDYVIQEAVNREIRRGGQVYFIHNRVESIYQIGQYLQGILPRVRIGIAHGQMAERQLEQVMLGFVQGEYDVLLSTTIVESGLDIPNVNTIIINNADQFGLSQLYQLRGRVGRSNVQAYSYLMTPREKILSETALKRLAVLRELNHLGAGFKISNYDLELRGAGNVLGSQQSGHIAAIGFELYTTMVEEAVTRIQEGETELAVAMDVKLTLSVEAGLPESYIESMNQRLEAYRHIAGCTDEESLWAVRAALEDRFGQLPRAAMNLFHSMQIRRIAANLSIEQIHQAERQLELVFSEAFNPDPNAILQFIHDSDYHPRLMPGNTLLVALPAVEPEAIIDFLHSFRKAISQDRNVDRPS